MSAVNHIAHDPATLVSTMSIQLFLTVFTGAAAADTGNNHPIALFKVLNCGTDFFHNTNTFMTENPAIKAAVFFFCDLFNFGVFTFPDPEVGTTNGDFAKFDNGISRLQNLGNGTLFKADIIGAVINHGFHCCHDRSPKGMRV